MTLPSLTSFCTRFVATTCAGLTTHSVGAKRHVEGKGGQVGRLEDVIIAVQDCQ